MYYIIPDDKDIAYFSRFVGFCSAVGFIFAQTVDGTLLCAAIGAFSATFSILLFPRASQLPTQLPPSLLTESNDPFLAAAMAEVDEICTALEPD